MSEQTDALVDIYADVALIRLDPAKSGEELRHLLESAALACRQRHMLGVVCLVESSSIHVCLALADSLEPIGEAWAGSQCRLGLVMRGSESRAACWYACLLASRRGIPIQRFDAERAALEWVAGPGPVPGMTACGMPTAGRIRTGMCPSTSEAAGPMVTDVQKHFNR
jgi:hypothetical protein